MLTILRTAVHHVKINGATENAELDIARPSKLIGSRIRAFDWYRHQWPWM